MKKVVSTAQFETRLKKLRDRRAKARIIFRIDQLKRKEHYSDCKLLGEGVKELRITEGKGYRVYFAETNNEVVILLLGGNK
ncbi:MAG: type II toxin-antitoxin system RelE/ParE family toxin [Flavobacteriia bacterium]|nr:type II toxin-antitoxin system RelE/ParE family toxin [Flavobacteriia bacterium]